MKKMDNVPRLSLGLLLGCLAMTCQDPGATNRVAQVGDRAITIAQYKAFYADLPKRLRSKKPEIEGHQEHLQSLIDKELLLLEAKATRLDRDPVFVRHQRKFLDRGIVGQFNRELLENIKVNEDELRAFFVETGRNRELMLQFLKFPSRQEAFQALEQIRAGADFAHFRRDDAKLAPLLRNLEGKFVPRDRIHPALQDVIFSLKLNEVSEPLRFGNTGFLVKVTAERSVPFADYAASEGLHGLFREWIFPRERERRLQELSQKYRPMAAPDGLKRFFQEAEAAGWDGISREVVLYEYDGGTITAGRLLDQLANRGKAGVDLSDTSLVMSFLRDVVMVEELVLTEAGHLGIDAPIRARFAENSDRALAEELLNRVVEKPVSVTREEVKTYFEDNYELFRGAEFSQVQEILVATEAEADTLLQQLHDGADFALLAAAHTLRSAGKNSGGKFHFHAYEKPLYKGLVEAAAKAPVGELQGPVPVEGGYSLFTVLSRERVERSLDDRRVEFKVRTVVKKIKQNRRFDDFIVQLRDKYADQVQVFESNLRLVAATGE